MKQGAGKAKGSQQERKVCKDLSLWISRGKRSDCFWRSAMSGGRATVAMKQGDTLEAQAGDVSYTHSLGRILLRQFLIEIKFYKTLDSHNLIFGEHIGNLYKFWKDVRSTAEEHKKSPMLIAKQNRKPEIVCVDRAGLQFLEGWNKEGVSTAEYHIGTLHRFGMEVLDYSRLIKNTTPIWKS